MGLSLFVVVFSLSTAGAELGQSQGPSLSLALTRFEFKPGEALADPPPAGIRVPITSPIVRLTVSTDTNSPPGRDGTRTIMLSQLDTDLSANAPLEVLLSPETKEVRFPVKVALVSAYHPKTPAGSVKFERPHPLGLYEGAIVLKPKNGNWDELNGVKSQLTGISDQLEHSPAFWPGNDYFIKFSSGTLSFSVEVAMSTSNPTNHTVASTVQSVSNNGQDQTRNVDSFQAWAVSFLNGLGIWGQLGIAAICIGIVGLAVWSTLPDNTKERVITWFVPRK